MWRITPSWYTALMKGWLNKIEIIDINRIIWQKTWQYSSFASPIWLSYSNKLMRVLCQEEICFFAPFVFVEDKWFRKWPSSIPAVVLRTSFCKSYIFYVHNKRPNGNQLNDWHSLSSLIRFCAEVSLLCFPSCFPL